MKLSSALVLGLLAGSASAARPGPSPSPSPSGYDQAVAAISGLSSASSNCKLQMAAKATLNKDSSVSGTVTYTNPTDKEIKVFSSPVAYVRSVVPPSAMGSQAVKDIFDHTAAGGSNGALRQYTPYAGPYYDSSCKGAACVPLMAVIEVDLVNCFKGASLLSGEEKGIPLAPKQSVTCPFSIAKAVVPGTPASATSISVEQMAVAANAYDMRNSGPTSGACSVAAKLA